MIWGMTLKPGEEYLHEVSHQQHLTLASLDCRPGKSYEGYHPISCLLLKTGNGEHVLCSLEKGLMHQQNLNLILHKGETLTFLVEGTSTVYITGYSDRYPEDIDEIKNETSAELSVGQREEIDGLDEFSQAPTTGERKNIVNTRSEFLSTPVKARHRKVNKNETEDTRTRQKRSSSTINEDRRPKKNKVQVPTVVSPNKADHSHTSRVAHGAAAQREVSREMLKVKEKSSPKEGPASLAAPPAAPVSVIECNQQTNMAQPVNGNSSSKDNQSIEATQTSVLETHRQSNAAQSPTYKSFPTDGQATADAPVPPTSAIEANQQRNMAQLLTGNSSSKENQSIEATQASVLETLRQRSPAQSPTDKSFPTDGQATADAPVPPTSAIEANQQRNMAQLLTDVSHHNIEFLKIVVKAIEAKVDESLLNDPLPESPDSMDYSAAENKENVKKKECIVELVQGSGVIITKQQMSMVHLQAARKGPEKIIRLLLRMLFSSKELATGCMKGRSHTKGHGKGTSKLLDPSKIQAIKEFILTKYKRGNGHPAISEPAFCKVVNTKCSDERKKFRK